MVLLTVLSIATFVIAYVNFMYVCGSNEEDFENGGKERIKKLFVTIVSFALLTSLQGVLGILTLIKAVNPVYHKFYGVLVLITYILVINVYVLYGFAFKSRLKFRITKDCADVLVYVAVAYLILERVVIPPDVMRIVVSALSMTLVPLTVMWWMYLKNMDYLFEPIKTRNIMLPALIFTLFFSVAVGAIETCPAFKCSFIAMPLVIAIVTMIVAIKEVKDVLKLI